MTEFIDGLYYEGEKIADTKAPHDVPIARRWEQRKFNAQLVNPANRRKLALGFDARSFMINEEKSFSSWT